MPVVPVSSHPSEWMRTSLHYLRLYLAEGVDAQTVHVVCGDLKRPIREGNVNPVRRRAERAPVGAHGRPGGRGEVERLVRADARQDESAPEVVARDRAHGVRRGY